MSKRKSGWKARDMAEKKSREEEICSVQRHSETLPLTLVVTWPLSTHDVQGRAALVLAAPSSLGAVFLDS